MLNDLYNSLLSAQHRSENEAELRGNWVEQIRAHLGIEIKVEKNRIDAARNNVIIEFKSPGAFSGRITSPAFQEAINYRLDPYIQTRSTSEGLPEEEYIGIATDGYHIAFAFRKNETIQHGPLLPLSEHSANLLATALVNAERRAVTPENLIEDFGHGSVAGDELMGALADELKTQLSSAENNKIKLLFEEWRTLYGQVADLSIPQLNSIRQSITFSASSLNDDELPGILFCIHTYNALLIKLLAAELISETRPRETEPSETEPSETRFTAYPNFCAELVAIKGQDDLLNRLNLELEKSGLFAGAGVHGFVEEAIFSWYTDSQLTEDGRERIASGIWNIASQLVLYRMDSVTDLRSRDILKVFYQTLVPETLRKALGEYYTPDWLAHLSCERAYSGDWLPVRVLDPTCGSGTFLLQVIDRKRQAAEQAGWSSADILDELASTVWGFDLNPLAIQTARVNYLFAIADHLNNEKGHQIEIPVLLADAVYSPARTPSSETYIVDYRIGSLHADLHITLPSDLAFKRERLDLVFKIMEEGIEDEADYTTVAENLVGSALTQREAADWFVPLSATYDQVLELHKKNWNGIWFRVIKNFFWSAEAEPFDIVIGNPPWVRWSALPEAYRERIKPTCQQYEIFSDTPYHGGNELDISGMITYTVGDKWLKPGGLLSFLITQPHFQAPSSQGFRSFKLREDLYLKPIEVNDLKELKPFPNAGKTALITLQKGANAPTYPVPYFVWHKKGGYSANLPADASLEEIRNRVTIDEKEATPVDNNRGPWAILGKGHFEEFRLISGLSDWVQGRKGVTTDLNGIFMVRVLNSNANTGLVQIQTIPEACGRKNREAITPARKFWIEPDALYPLVKGASDFSAYDFSPRNPDIYIIVPNAGIKRDDYKISESFISSHRRLKNYFDYYDDVLCERSTYRIRQAPNGAPPYAIYNVGPYTFSPYKVMWPEQGRFVTAVASRGSVPLKDEDQPYVPDHKIYFVETEDAETAYYLSGVLNCNLVREYIESHTIGIQRSNIFKHLSVPRYEPSDDQHSKLSMLSRKAHFADPQKRDDLARKANQVARKILLGNV